jgi:hypothetical protein
MSTAIATITLHDAVAEFLADQADRIGLTAGHGIQTKTYNAIEKQLHIVLGLKKSAREIPIDLDADLHEITKADLEKLVRYWLRLPEGVTSTRTAVNYLKVLKQFLAWCEGHEDYDWQMPRGGAALFIFRNYNHPNVTDYDPATLRRLLDACTPRVRLYVLLGLNCGFYQQDISDLHHNDLVVIDGKPAIWRKRSKSAHQNDFHVLTWLWPETYELLLSESAPKENAHGRILLNSHGDILVREEQRGEAGTDAISRAYNRMREDIGVDLSLRQLRKIGWNKIKAITGNEDMAKLWSGQAVAGVSRFYDRADYQPLLAPVEAYRQVLISDGVLVAPSLATGT